MVLVLQQYQSYLPFVLLTTPHLIRKTRCLPFHGLPQGHVFCSSVSSLLPGAYLRYSEVQTHLHPRIHCSCTAGSRPARHHQYHHLQPPSRDCLFFRNEDSEVEKREWIVLNQPQQAEVNEFGHCFSLKRLVYGILNEMVSGI